MSEENTFSFPLDHDSPLSFVDVNVVALAQVEDVYQLNEVLGAFLADDVQNFVSEHKDILYLLSHVWNEAFMRIVLDVEDMIFPDGMLMIPPIFEKLGWSGDADTWEKLHSSYTVKFEKDTCLPNALAILFIEAMQGDMQCAIDHFVERVTKFNDEDTLHAERYLENLKYFGWPEMEKTA